MLHAWGRVVKRQRQSSTRATISIRGGYKLAAMQSKGYASQGTTIDVLLQSIVVSRQSLAQWERLLASNLYVQGHLWYQDHYNFLGHCHNAVWAGNIQSQSWLSFEIHAVRADATNSCPVLSSKAHTCEIRSYFKHLDVFLNGCEDSEDAPVPPEVMERCALADLQKVPAGCSGQDVRKMLLHQVSSVGANSWLHPPSLPPRPLVDPPPNVDLREAPCHIACYFFRNRPGRRPETLS